MGKMVVVQGDAVQGTDKHNVMGNATNPAPPPPTVPYTGIGSYEYDGRDDGRFEHVRQDRRQASRTGDEQEFAESRRGGSAGGRAFRAGRQRFHASNARARSRLTLSIKDVIGIGVPNAAAGSALLTIGGVKVLLDGDKIDTCDGTGDKANSTVTAVRPEFRELFSVGRDWRHDGWRQVLASLLPSRRRVRSFRIPTRMSIFGGRLSRCCSRLRASG